MTSNIAGQDFSTLPPVQAALGSLPENATKTALMALLGPVTALQPASTAIGLLKQAALENPEQGTSPGATLYGLLSIIKTSLAGFAVEAVLKQKIVNHVGDVVFAEIAQTSEAPAAVEEAKTQIKQFLSGDDSVGEALKNNLAQTIMPNWPPGTAPGAGGGETTGSSSVQLAQTSAIHSSSTSAAELPTTSSEQQQSFAEAEGARSPSTAAANVAAEIESSSTIELNSAHEQAPDYHHTQESKPQGGQYLRKADPYVTNSKSKLTKFHSDHEIASLSGRTPVSASSGAKVTVPELSLAGKTPGAASFHESTASSGLNTNQNFFNFSTQDFYQPFLDLTEYLSKQIQQISATVVFLLQYHENWKLHCMALLLVMLAVFSILGLYCYKWSTVASSRTGNRGKNAKGAAEDHDIESNMFGGFSAKQGTKSKAPLTTPIDLDHDCTGLFPENAATAEGTSFQSLRSAASSLYKYGTFAGTKLQEQLSGRSSTAGTGSADYDSEDEEDF
ncbi:unnamed protein product [Amoebophrya sp. A120]|nr:unnamed protein product [Amoebophrya sp. A120]|eukprot:GSA120T00004008001.1